MIPEHVIKLAAILVILWFVVRLGPLLCLLCAFGAFWSEQWSEATLAIVLFGLLAILNAPRYLSRSQRPRATIVIVQDERWRHRADDEMLWYRDAGRHGPHWIGWPTISIANTRHLEFSQRKGSETRNDAL